LLLLQITREDGSEICWHEVSATGTCPEHIYNHACASFAGGTRVCVFGGDIPKTDPEFDRIAHRMRCQFVYILHISTQVWQVVDTSGSVPSWRSFHAAVAHTSLLDGREYFVTFGGTPDHCEPLTGGSNAGMIGYELDLQSFLWRQGSPVGILPAARIRFGVARWGRHLLVHGGHRQEDDDDTYVARLNLNTLRWAHVGFTNSPPPLPGNAFETGSPQAGIVVGGAHQTPFGPRILTRLKLFRLADPKAPHDSESNRDDEEEALMDPDRGNEDGDEDAAARFVRVQLQGADGRPRILQLPLMMMLALHAQAGSQEALVDMLRDLVTRQESQNNLNDE